MSVGLKLSLRIKAGSIGRFDVATAIFNKIEQKKEKKGKVRGEIIVYYHFATLPYLPYTVISRPDGMSRPPYLQTSCRLECSQISSQLGLSIQILPYADLSCSFCPAVL